MEQAPHARTYYSDRATRKDSLNREPIFLDITSCSKSSTAAAIGVLVDDNEI